MNISNLLSLSDLSVNIVMKSSLKRECHTRYCTAIPTALWHAMLWKSDLNELQLPLNLSAHLWKTGNLAFIYCKQGSLSKRKKVIIPSHEGELSTFMYLYVPVQMIVNGKDSLDAIWCVILYQQCSCQVCKAGWILLQILEINALNKHEPFLPGIIGMKP